MFVTTARLIPEKQDMSACLPLVFQRDDERTVMHISRYHASVIDNLRDAAKASPEVYEFLRVFAWSFRGLDVGDTTFMGDEKDRGFLLAAQVAFSFVANDNDVEEFR